MQFAAENIWIIGAGSDIGEATARYLSQEGANIILSAQLADRISNLSHSLAGNNLAVPMDITDFSNLPGKIDLIYKSYPHLDRVFFFPTHYEASLIIDMKESNIDQSFLINVQALMHLSIHLLPKLRLQEARSQFNICASLAGLGGLKCAQPYSATKAALINFAESLKLEEDKVEVKLINPGFVKGPLTSKNDFNLPFMISPDKAAKYILKGVQGRGFEIDFPQKMSWLLKFMRLLPYWLYFKIARLLA